MSYKFNIKFNSNFIKIQKDEIPQLTKSGIHQKKCNDFDGKCTGQMETMINTQFNEHFALLKYKRPEKPAIAAFIETNQSFNKNNRKCQTKMFQNLFFFYNDIQNWL